MTDELCEWPSCSTKALCRSGNYGDRLVCAHHFTITNGIIGTGWVDAALCPERVRLSIEAYVQLGRPPGDFVRAVLANDLYDAVSRADDINLPALPHIVAYVIAKVPAALCGSRKAVNDHIARKSHAGDGIAYLTKQVHPQPPLSVGTMLCPSCGEPSHPGRFCGQTTKECRSQNG